VSRPARALRLEELEGYGDAGRPTWLPIRAQLGIEAFGVNAWQATEPGQELIGEHDELGPGAGGHEELYLVTAGRATFTVDGERFDAPAGTLVFVPEPESRRRAVGEETGTVVLAVGATPGAAFSVSPWERSAQALRFWQTEEWDRAIEELSAQIEERPESAGTLYNLACAEARAGRREDALYHLRRAVEVDARFEEYAQTDADLDAIRDDARFPRVPR
jgi:tetratricopeptide (TPR) repeat protein